ncbi:MAG: DNA polymerase [Betaproteobacteria bacterium]|nr:DNA polymerase [Betaproteobacteria bacterium]
MNQLHPLRNLYVDFNSYFASVEQQLRPELRGKAIGVLPVLAETTCCIAASYQAKAFGVKTGTPVYEARKRCPGIVLVEARPALYVEMHHQLVAAVEDCTHVEKVLSIDEMTCSLSGSEQRRDKALALAAAIKRSIAEKVGEHLRCSIGIAPNTFLAKTASNMLKPDGCTVIEAADLPDILYPLELRALTGIGKAMEARLQRHGIRSMRALCQANARQLRHAWGSIEGERMYARLRGEASPAAVDKDRASLGHSHVLPPELRNPQSAWSVLHRLLQKAAMRLRSEALVAGSLSAGVKFVDGRHWQQRMRFDPTSDTLQLLEALKRMWAARPVTRTAPLAVSVTLTDLQVRTHQSGSLWDNSPQTAHDQLNAVIDAVNLRYGKNTLYFGGAHRAIDAGAAPMRIAFQHIPDISLEGDD